MPFARVGAMPQPPASSTSSSSKKYNGGRGSGGSNGHRPKGITMEDLKKQTALRLAQEQHLSNGDISQGGFPPTLQPTQHTPHHTPRRGQMHPSDDSYGMENYTNNHSMRQNQVFEAQSLPNNGNMMMPNHSHFPSPTPSMRQSPLLQESHSYPVSSRVQQHPGGYATSTYGSISYANVAGRGSGTGLSSSETAQGYRITPIGNGCAPSPSMAPATSMAKTKLPHGLTVHELKEMTKARLQAEAAEKMDGELMRERGVSPLDFDVSSTGGQRERALSRDSACRNSQLYHSSMQMGSIMVSKAPIPSGLESFAHPLSHSPSFRHVNRTDTWDSASVASHNSNAYSENFGSETASDVSVGWGAVNRARSFTVPVLPSGDDVMEGLPMLNKSIQESPSPNRIVGFVAAVGGNRRRAVTLSPGTGSILEDRPHHGTWSRDHIQPPAFASSVGSTSTSLQRGYSPVLEQLGLDSPRDRGGENFNGIESIDYIPGISDLQLTAMGPSELRCDSSNSEVRIPAPPPGFNSAESDHASARPNMHTAFLAHDSLQRKNPWNVDHRSQLASVEHLATDLGSILNFSGSERGDRGRANTYTFGSNLPLSARIDEDFRKSNGNNTFPPSDADSFRY